RRFDGELHGPVRWEEGMPEGSRNCPADRGRRGARGGAKEGGSGAGVDYRMRLHGYTTAMIFSQSLRRDLNSVAGVMFSTLFTIMVTTSLIRFLGRAATDRIAAADVIPLIAFSSIRYIPVLLVLTVFLSILMVMSRAWRDSEMVIWFSSGQSLTA